MRPRLKLVTAFFAGMALGVILYVYTPEIIMSSDTHPPPNLVTVSKRIDTSGQPSAEQLAGLKLAGYDLIINLAPPQSLGSIANEGAWWLLQVSPTSTSPLTGQSPV